MRINLDNNSGTLLETVEVNFPTIFLRSLGVGVRRVPVTGFRGIRIRYVIVSRLLSSLSVPNNG